MHEARLQISLSQVFQGVGVDDPGGRRPLPGGVSEVPVDFLITSSREAMYRASPVDNALDRKRYWLDVCASMRAYISENNGEPDEIKSHGRWQSIRESVARWVVLGALRAGGNVPPAITQWQHLLMSKLTPPRVE